MKSLPAAFGIVKNTSDQCKSHNIKSVIFWRG